jgi:hypothetical protein
MMAVLATSWCLVAPEVVDNIAVMGSDRRLNNLLFGREDSQLRVEFLELVQVEDAVRVEVSVFADRVARISEDRIETADAGPYRNLNKPVATPSLRDPRIRPLDQGRCSPFTSSASAAAASEISVRNALTPARSGSS